MADDKWSKGIKAELIDLKLEVTAIKAQLKAMNVPVPDAKAVRAKSQSFGDDTFPTGNGLPKLVGFEDEKIDYIDGMVKATYSIREASTAMRGYMMLLGQAGLSKNQKKMIRDIENSMMAVMKLATTIQYLIKIQQLAGASSLGPMGILYLVMAGGSTAASIAFGSKLAGGNV